MRRFAIESSDFYAVMVQQIETFADERVTGVCVYCGGAPATREHVPSRVLLDEPYPENLPRVFACRDCNSGVSLDEEYVACAVECALVGSADPLLLRRQKIRRILMERPALAARIRTQMFSDNGVTALAIEMARAHRVLVKLARGHAMFELATSVGIEKLSIAVSPLHVLEPTIRAAFECPIESDLWGEVGSRKLMIVDTGLPYNGWIDAQTGRYRYLAAVTRVGIVVRMVLSEYLAAEVSWS